MVAVQAWGDKRRYGVEMRGQGNATTGPGSPDVAPARRDLLNRHVPATGDKPPGNEFDRPPLVAGRRLNRKELGGERDDVGHGRNIVGLSFRIYLHSMRKAIQLMMDVEVEGDDEPQRDFTRRAIQAVRDAVKVGRSRYPDLTITVHKIEAK
jgi:hypothetical protein